MAGTELVFDPYSREFLLDHHNLYRRLREETPVYHNEALDFYALTHYADVAAAYRDVETFSSTRGFDLAMVQSGQPPPPTILFMDPPEHRRVRGLVSKSFGARAIRSLESATDGLVGRYLAAADRARFDVVGDFSALFPVEIIANMAGVPEDSREQVRWWVAEVNRVDPGKKVDNDERNEILGKSVMFFYDLVQQRILEPLDDGEQQQMLALLAKLVMHHPRSLST